MAENNRLKNENKNKDNIFKSLKIERDNFKCDNDWQKRERRRLTKENEKLKKAIEKIENDHKKYICVFK